MIRSIFDHLSRQLDKGRLRRNVRLAPYTTFKSGGPAEYYFEAETEEDLIVSQKSANELAIPFTLLGGASNVVVADRGINGLVVRNRVMYKKPIREDKAYGYLTVSSGYPMTRLAQETAKAGFSGLEYHVGLPGTVGGALYMNSKWTNPTCYVGDCLYEAGLVDREGKVKIVTKDYFEFGYDQSILQKTREIVVWATFKLKKDAPQKLVDRGKMALSYRRQTQPFGIASSGCFFKNINGQSAGKIIERLGFKGLTIGNLKVSDKHANFVINLGGGTSDDYIEIVDIIKKKAEKELGVKLEEEVLFLPEGK